ncbi:MAG: efflux RND transporter periplasmic adaptor subunit [Bacteroidales bacterium]|nr:efflux RND transporter periplasmic adaptor subunit [Bacteroidales bacterium]
MDIMVEKPKGMKKVFAKKYISLWVIGALLLAAVIYILNTESKSVTVRTDDFRVGEVFAGDFDEYIRIQGQVMPMTTIQISPLQGGIVDEIVNEEGANLKAGDVILRLSNDDLDMQILNSESDLAERENMLRNTMIQMEQQKLDLEQNRLTYALEVRRAKRAFEQAESLYNDNLCSKEEYARAKEDYDIANDRLKLVISRAKQDSIFRSVEIRQLNESLENMRLNMQLIRKRKENLTIKAPIDGELGFLDAVRGQIIQPGMKIGQINNLDSYKIEAQIDEHYIDRVTAGLDATFERNNEQFSAQIRKVYPEVRSGKFKADFKFSGEEPENIRTGQTYYLNLQLGQPTDAIMIPKGSFYQQTGGQWIYVVDKSGDFAVRRSIKIGRQNPKYYEVLSGLEAGEKVIISGYESFGDNNRVDFKQ